MFFPMQKYIYSETVFNTHYTEIKQMFLIKPKCPLFSFKSSNSSQLSQQIFLVFQDVLKTSCRRLQRNSFSSSKMSSRCLQDVFKTSSRHVCNASSEDVFKTSSRGFHEEVLQLCLGGFFETSWRRPERQKKILRWRRLQNVFKTYSVRLHQDECLLG